MLYQIKYCLFLAKKFIQYFCFNFWSLKIMGKQNLNLISRQKIRKWGFFNILLTYSSHHLVDNTYFITRYHAKKILILCCSCIDNACRSSGQCETILKREKNFMIIRSSAKTYLEHYITTINIKMWENISLLKQILEMDMMNTVKNYLVIVL